MTRARRASSAEGKTSSRSRFHHGFEDAHVTCASTKVSGQTHPDLRFSWIGMTSEQVRRRENHPGCADAALRAAVIDECLLHRAQSVASAGNTFNGRDGRVLGLKHRRQAAVDQLTVD